MNECIENFRRLHVEVAGRETRSNLTWLVQRNGIINGNDFVVNLYNDENELIGASLINVTKTAGLYAVGAYDKSLFDQPKTHLCQWLAISHMKELGIKWYYIGRRPYPGDFDTPTEKEISIGHFKEGFASDVFAQSEIDWK